MPDLENGTSLEYVQQPHRFIVNPLVLLVVSVSVSFCIISIGINQNLVSVHL